MNIFEEILWPQFVQYEHIKRLPLNEQVKYYNQYLYELTIARQNWITYQNKGNVVEEEKYLAQEESYTKIDGTIDYYLILQEDGSKIIIT
jgi:hypothetical protein